MEEVEGKRENLQTKEVDGQQKKMCKNGEFSRPTVNNEGQRMDEVCLLPPCKIIGNQAEVSK